MSDILIYQAPNGGDFNLVGNDIQFGSELWNQVLLGLFGGNIEQSTKRTYQTGEQRLDWWGNVLLFEQEPNEQYNSDTERVLRNTPLTSAGLGEIQKAVQRDLKFLKEIADVEFSVSMISNNRLRISVNFSEPENSEFAFIWDSARETVITNVNV